MNFHCEFNYYFETLGLLSYCNNFSTTKIELIEELNRLGVDGEKVYNAHMLDWEKLIATFDKMKIMIFILRTSLMKKRTSIPL